jgi:hypothetical protein
MTLSYILIEGRRIYLPDTIDFIDMIGDNLDFQLNSEYDDKYDKLN